MYELCYIHSSSFAIIPELQYSKYHRVVIELPTIFSHIIAQLKQATEQSVDDTLKFLLNTLSNYGLRVEGQRFLRVLEKLKNVTLSKIFLKNLAQDADIEISEQMSQLLVHSLRKLFPNVQLITSKPTPGVYVIPIAIKTDATVLQFSSANLFTIFMKVPDYIEISIYSNHLTHSEARILSPLIGLEPLDFELLEKAQVSIIISFNGKTLYIDSYAAFDPTGIKLRIRMKNLFLTTVLAPPGILAGNVLTDMLPSLDQAVLATWVTQRYIHIVTKIVPDLKKFENYELLEGLGTKKIDLFEMVGTKILPELDELAGENPDDLEVIITRSNYLYLAINHAKAAKLATELHKQIARINSESNQEFVNCYYTLKHAKFGILSTKSTGIRSFPIVFFLIRDAIIALLPIIYISKWAGLLTYEKVCITILQPNHIKIKGRAIIEQGDLDNEWQKYLNFWEEKEPGIMKLLKKSETTSYYWKRVVVKIIPEKLIAESSNGIISTFERR